MTCVFLGGVEKLIIYLVNNCVVHRTKKVSFKACHSHWLNWHGHTMLKILSCMLPLEWYIVHDLYVVDLAHKPS